MSVCLCFAVVVLQSRHLGEAGGTERYANQAKFNAVPSFLQRIPGTPGLQEEKGV